MTSTSVLLAFRLCLKCPWLHWPCRYPLDILILCPWRHPCHDFLHDDKKIIFKCTYTISDPVTNSFHNHSDSSEGPWSSDRILGLPHLPRRGRARLSSGQTLYLLSAQLHDRQLRAGIDSHIDTSVKPSLYRSNHQNNPSYKFDHE